MKRTYANLDELMAEIYQVIGPEMVPDYDVFAIADALYTWEDGHMVADLERDDFWLIVAEHDLTEDWHDSVELPEGTDADVATIVNACTHTVRKTGSCTGADTINTASLAQFGKDIEVVICDSAAGALGADKAIQDGGRGVGIDVYLIAAGDTQQILKEIMTGKISAVKSDPRYGLTVVMEHEVSGRRFSTVYCGLAKTADGLLAGNKVEAGAVIGTLGDDIFCEKAQGAHLHFELTENNEPLDPSQYWK